MLLLLFLSLLTITSTVAANTDGKSCTLQCNPDVDAVCKFATPEDLERYSDHPLTVDGKPLDWHSLVTNADGMFCSCPSGWTGLTCETPFESCDDEQHKCYNNGICVPGLLDANGNEQWFCNCERAFDSDNNHYVGKYCEQQPSEPCDGSGLVYCLNEGSCNPDFPDYGEACDCTDDFFGPHCEYKDDTVPTCDLECQNGGTCSLGERPDEYTTDQDYGAWNSEAVDDMHCVCAPGFDGELCEVDKTPCGPDAFCFHGGTCVERIVNEEILHHCDCSTASTDTTDYAGRFCQFEATSYCTKTAGLNGHLFCVNGGECREDNPHKGCICDSQYAGFSCEFVKEEFVQQEEGQTNVTAPVDEPNVIACDLVCKNEGVCRHGVKNSAYVGDLQLHSPHLQPTEDLMHCVCPDGFAGLYCEEEVDVCGENEHMCLHGSKCILNSDDEHACDCQQADADHSETGYFAGDSCEHPVNDICTDEKPGPSQPLLFCVNGGKCLDHVELTDPHPGCKCTDGFTGPHCELSSEAPEELPAVQASASSAESSSGSSNGARVAAITISLLATVAAAAFFGTKYAKEKKSSHTMNDNIRWASEYQDRPGEDEPNLAPRRRRDSTTPRGGYEDYPANAHSSSTDPFATHLAPKTAVSSDQEDGNEEEAQPQIYIGPPRDEDGHELHNVDII